MQERGCEIVDDLERLCQLLFEVEAPYIINMTSLDLREAEVDYDPYNEDQIRSVNFFVDAIRNCTSLRHLDLSYKTSLTGHFTRQNLWQRLFEVNGKNLTGLILSGCYELTAGPDFCAALSKLPNLEHLELSCCDLQSNNCREILERLLTNNHRLVTLDLSRNTLNKKPERYFDSCLREKPQPPVTDILCKLISTTTTLRTLDLSGNSNISLSDRMAMHKALKTNSSITELNVQRTEVPFNETPSSHNMIFSAGMENKRQILLVRQSLLELMVQICIKSSSWLLPCEIWKIVFTHLDLPTLKRSYSALEIFNNIWTLKDQLYNAVARRLSFSEATGGKWVKIKQL